MGLITASTHRRRSRAGARVAAADELILALTIAAHRDLERIGDRFVFDRCVGRTT